MCRNRHLRQFHNLISFSFRSETDLAAINKFYLSIAQNLIIVLDLTNNEPQQQFWPTRMPKRNIWIRKVVEVSGTQRIAEHDCANQNNDNGYVFDFRNFFLSKSNWTYVIPCLDLFVDGFWAISHWIILFIEESRNHHQQSAHHQQLINFFCSIVSLIISFFIIIFFNK